MIDFIKFELVNADSEIFQDNPLLEFETKVNTRTGELGAYIQAFYKGLEFQIFHPTDAHPSGRITVEGSLHKYWNNGGHNFNDFDINDVTEVLHDLRKKFQIIPENCQIKQLEIGININSPFPTKTILQCCIMHKTDLFKWGEVPDEGCYLQVKHGTYYIKIYDKQKHYVTKGFTVPDETMRFEIKYKREKLANTLSKKGIITLQDVLNFGLHNFKPYLLQEWENVLFYDFTTLDSSRFKYRYNNQIFWINLKPENFKYHRKKLNRITNLNPDNLKKKIAGIIAEKIDLLNKETTQIKPLNIDLIRVVDRESSKASKKKVCAVTGLNIEMQKEGSILLSHGGLKYYYRTDKKVYNEVKRKYLSKLWSHADHKTQIKEIAHNIRNTRNNRKNRQQDLYSTRQHQLFPLELFA